MFRRLLKEERNQQGEVMLEASFILVSIILLLLAMLSISFLFYQEAMMTSVATEIASDVGRKYQFTAKDIKDDTIAEQDFGEPAEDKDKDKDFFKNLFKPEERPIKMYRINLGMFFVDKAHDERADTYAKWRIAKASLGLNPSEPTASCQIHSTGIGRAYVKVTVEQTSDFFLSDVLDYMDITGKNTAFSSTAYAECVDLMGYTSTVNFTEYVATSLEELKGFGDLHGGVNNLFETIKKVFF